MKENKKAIYLSDSPNIEQDSFQVHSNIAETLFEIINRHVVSKNSFTIGLFGEWGSGKSFIINKLQNKIIDDVSEKLTYLYIDVWKYTGFPLLRGILFDLNKQFKSYYKNGGEKYKFFKDGYVNPKGKALRDTLNYDETFESHSKLTSKDFKEKLKTIWRRYKYPYIILTFLFVLFFFFQFFPSEWLSNSYLKRIYEILKSTAPISSFIGIGGLLLFLFKKPLEDIVELIFFRNTVKNFTEKANFSPEQFEDIFKDILSKIEDEKYVIVFDNLDRCEPSIAYETLSTIKTFMDINNCFYIIPADDEAIKKYLSNSNSEEKNNSDSFQRKFAEEFIDKIFQTYVRIPVLKEVERDKYIQEQLKKIDFEERLTVEDIETITQLLYFAYKGESPRNIIRFINDYSTYFQLALKSLPKLLDNITLFTIMIAIKQKWYQFEKTLIESPTFFAEYPKNKNIIKNIDTESKNDLLAFLDNISVFYIPQIKNESIDTYIHLKESAKSLEISEILKNNQPDEFILNNESVKILINEFKKNISTKGVFATNSFSTFAFLIKNNPKNELSIKLIKEFWIGFINIPPDQVKSILGELLEDNILIDIINKIKIKYIQYHKNEIEQKFIAFLNEPIEKDSEFEKYEKIFEIILTSEYKFTPDRMKKLFENWKKENQYLNSLLSIISQKEKTIYLPENVLNQLISNNIDTDSIELLKNWDHNCIPMSYGIELLNVSSTRLASRNFGNLQQLNQQKPQIEQDHELVLLLDSSFVNQENKEDFFQNLTDLITRIFQFAANTEPLFELAVNFWFEVVYFASVDNNMIDSKLLQIYNSSIKSNSAITSYFKEKIEYPKELLSLELTKQEIFDASQELQKSIYEKLDNEDFANFKLILPQTIEVAHIETVINFLEEKQIQVDNNKLSEYLLQKIILELVNENQDISSKLEYLNTNFDLKEHKKIIIDHKNGFIDYYKNNPSSAITTLKVIKSILTYTELYNHILKTLLRFLNSKLDESEPITDFANLTVLVETNKNKEDINLQYTIAKKCLEKNQEINENNFGLKIIEKIYNNITSEQKKEIDELITTNDNSSKWNEEMIDILKELGIISAEKSKG